MRVLFAAGGTGGHIYPAIAVAKEILRRDASSDIRFVGTSRGLETRLVPDAGFRLETIESSGLKNVGLKGTLKGLLTLPKSYFAARKIISEFQPQTVVGAGGYVTGAVLLAAHFKGVPTLIMESNALPGFTNRQLARFIDKAALTFEESKAFFGSKGVVTGNPVRREFFDIAPKSRDNASFNLLLFGGSQGARAVNRAMVEALPHLEKFQNRLKIVHQTGELDFDEVSKGYEKTAFAGSDVRKYIKSMPDEFAKADLIVSRAGATTCAEVCAAGKASLMVPLPTAADDHQRKNAEALQENGAAKMILQKDLNGSILAREIAGLIENLPQVSAMENAAKKMVKGDAAAEIADLIEHLVRKR